MAGGLPDRAALTVLVGQLVKVPGVVSATANALTGKILLHHTVELSAIVEHCRAADLLAIESDDIIAAGPRPTPSQPLYTFALIALSLYQATRGSFLPSAFALLIQAAEMARAARDERAH
ncbi:MAG: hypothetical protein GC199_04575 [Alphaproteobacteria bacterium]|nr:hypothetical protein [Alphaproteobacteria bacterium]